VIRIEPAQSGMSLCRACGAQSSWRILFEIGQKVSPERVDLCEDCALELGGAAERLRLHLVGKRLASRVRGRS